MDISYELHRIAGQIRKLALRIRVGRTWRDQDGTMSRAYPDYDSYVAHQRTKLDAMRSRSLRNHDARFFDAVRQRLDGIPISLSGRSVLCLGARQGSEVRAFIDAGAFAVGVDLNPGKNNAYVLTGDFHALQFASGSVSVVYTNSIDHAFDVERMLAEIQRVLSSDGYFILEAGRGVATGDGPGFYESFAWENPDVLIEKTAKIGFTLEDRSEFDVPWPGVQFILRKQTSTGTKSDGNS